MGFVYTFSLPSLPKNPFVNSNLRPPNNFDAMLLHSFLQIKWLIRGSKEGGSLRVQERFIAGSLAGATAQTIIYPMEVSLK